MSCYNSAGTGQFTNSTQIPALYPNGTEYFPFTYGQFLPALDKNVACGGPTYLRPDVGGALLPWLYSGAALLVHLPIVLIRVARWDRVQILSLALATLTIGVTLQSYKSTSLSPDKVLVWMPLTLTLDAGSMLQLAVLIVEDIGFHSFPKAFRQFGRSKPVLPAYPLYQPVGKDNNITYQQVQMPLNDIVTEEPKEDPDLLTKIFIAIGAVVLLIVIMILQIIGVVHAAKGRDTPDLTVSWCSPIFELFAVAVSDGNCNLYPVTQNSGKGIGCVNLEGTRQKNWLEASVILGSMALVFELFDFLILMLVHGKARWRSVKMKRPWFTVSYDPFLVIERC
jgi:hypothetical protein